MHICRGSPEPRHSNEVHVACAGSNGNLCTVYVHQQPPHICATISALNQCVKNALGAL